MLQKCDESHHGSVPPPSSNTSPEWEWSIVACCSPKLPPSPSFQNMLNLSTGKFSANFGKNRPTEHYWRSEMDKHIFLLKGISNSKLLATETMLFFCHLKYILISLYSKSQHLNIHVRFRASQKQMFFFRKYKLKRAKTYSHVMFTSVIDIYLFITLLASFQIEIIPRNLIWKHHNPQRVAIFLHTTGVLQIS